MFLELLDAGASLLANVTFEIQLATLPVSDVVAQNLAVWHTPAQCEGVLFDAASAARLGRAVNTLCVSDPCDGSGCNLTVTLPQPRQYVLKVRSRAALGAVVPRQRLEDARGRVRGALTVLMVARVAGNRCAPGF